MDLLLPAALLCQNATEPSRELDRIVALAAGWVMTEDSNFGVVDEYWKKDGKYLGDFLGEREWAAATGLPYFTSSMDAAKLLIPSSRHTELASQDRHSLRWKWVLRGGFGIRSESRGQTDTLALCAAALRAQHACLEEASYNYSKVSIERT